MNECMQNLYGLLTEMGHLTRRNPRTRLRHTLGGLYKQVKQYCSERGLNSKFTLRQSPKATTATKQMQTSPMVTKTDVEDALNSAVTLTVPPTATLSPISSSLKKKGLERLSAKIPSPPPLPDVLLSPVMAPLLVSFTKPVAAVVASPGPITPPLMAPPMGILFSASKKRKTPPVSPSSVTQLKTPEVGFTLTNEVVSSSGKKSTVTKSTPVKPLAERSLPLLTPNAMVKATPSSSNKKKALTSSCPAHKCISTPLYAKSTPPGCVCPRYAQTTTPIAPRRVTRHTACTPRSPRFTPTIRKKRRRSAKMAGAAACASTLLPVELKTEISSGRKNLRPSGVKRSPGGTPTKRRRSSAPTKNTVAKALQTKFKSVRKSSSPNKENTHSSFSSSDEWK